MENRYLREEARETLSGNWVMTAVVFALMGGGSAILTGMAGAVPLIGWLASFFIMGIFTKGIIYFSFNLIEEKQVSFDAALKGINDWLSSGISLVLISLYTSLWGLLFVVPGIIKALSYSQTLFILADNPQLSPTQAITKSRELMDGYKMQYATLQFSFIGWSILSVLTCGIGFLFLVPYTSITLTNFYLKLKDEKGLV